MFNLFKNALRGTVAVAAAGSVLILKKHCQGEKFTNPVRADGKVAIVTGANTGIGKETARELAKRGAVVYMACRDMERCENAKAEIIEESKNENVHCRECDLASFKSITAFAENFMLEQSKLDILINNGGVMDCKRHLTKEGIEWQLGVNHMGHFLLTHLLLQLLKSSAPSRIVVVSSLFHHGGTINLNDLNSESSYEPYKAHAQSKLANILFAQELAEQLKGTGVTVNALHPGIVDTGIHFRYDGCSMAWRKFIQILTWPFLKTPQNGAQTSLYVALEPSLDNVTGKYFTDCRENNVATQAKDDDVQKWLWNASQNWILPPKPLEIEKEEVIEEVVEEEQEEEMEEVMEEVKEEVKEPEPEVAQNHPLSLANVILHIFFKCKFYLV